MRKSIDTDLLQRYNYPVSVKKNLKEVMKTQVVAVGMLELSFIATLVAMAVVYNKWTEYFIGSSRFRISTLVVSGTISWMLASSLSTSKLGLGVHMLFVFHSVFAWAFLSLAAGNIAIFAIRKIRKTGTG